mmetsp:Transcript_28859/g.54957  ORF Transcript_28859/g.54957 Transcript_28859/m.54957 type:complete len:200 (-) Transcript_28859:911-1510(-)
MLDAVKAISPLNPARPLASITSLGQPLPTGTVSPPPSVALRKSSAPAFSCALICGVPFRLMSAAPVSALPPKSAFNSRSAKRRSGVSVICVVRSTDAPRRAGNPGCGKARAAKNASVLGISSVSRPATSPAVLARPSSASVPPPALTRAFTGCTCPVMKPAKPPMVAITSTASPAGRRVAAISAGPNRSGQSNVRSTPE